MSHKEHEQLLANVITEFRERGWEVIRLSGTKKRKTPDAIAINGKNIKTVGIEVTRSKDSAGFYTRKLQYKKYGFETDDIIIIANGFNVDRRTSPEAYYLALELRKKLTTYKKIKEILKQKFDVDVSQCTIASWWNRGVKPLSVKALEEAYG